MFVIIGRNGQLFRMRQTDAQADPVICFESAEMASEWMAGSKVSRIDHSIKEITENPEKIVGQMLGIPSENVNFTMIRPKLT